MKYIILILLTSCNIYPTERCYITHVQDTCEKQENGQSCMLKPVEVCEPIN